MATDSLSVLRTVGFYMLSVCDLSKSQLAEFAQFHGSSDSLLRFAITYDAAADELLHQHIFDTPLHYNVTELRTAMYGGGFDATCNNLTQAERTELTLEWGHEMEVYILTVDEIRESVVIPSILQVKTLSFLTSCNQTFKTSWSATADSECASNSAIV